MNCESYEDLLGDYVDGVRAASRPGDERLAAFERHLAGCARCQALVADFTIVRGAASTLEDHVPPQRLWTRIAASIEEERRRPWWQRPLGHAVPAWAPVAAAAALVLLIAGATWLAWRHEPAQAPQQAVSAPAEPDAIPAEQHYEAAIAGLQQLADAQNASLDPETRAVLKENLAVLDRAISESRAALADEPENALAQESLLDALDTKVALLQDTVALAADAGAPSDDAAAAAKELN
jgi:putative zinc finger protein